MNEVEGLMGNVAPVPEIHQDDKDDQKGKDHENQKATETKSASPPFQRETSRGNESNGGTGCAETASEAPQRLSLSLRKNFDGSRMKSSVTPLIYRATLSSKPKRSMAARKTVPYPKNPPAAPARSARKTAMASKLSSGSESDSGSYFEEFSRSDSPRISSQAGEQAAPPTQAPLANPPPFLSPPRNHALNPKKRPLSSLEDAVPTKTLRTYTIDSDHRKRMAETAIGPGSIKRQRRSEGHYRQSPEVPTVLVSNRTIRPRRKAARKQVSQPDIQDLTQDPDSDDEVEGGHKNSPELNQSKGKEKALSESSRRPVEAARAELARTMAQGVGLAEPGSSTHLIDDARELSDAEVPNDNAEVAQEDPYQGASMSEPYNSQSPHPASPTPDPSLHLSDCPSWELPTIEGVAQDLSAASFHPRKYSSVFSRKLARHTPPSSSEYPPSYDCRPFLRKNMRIRLQGISAFFDPGDPEAVDFFARQKEYRRLESARRKEDNALGIDMKERFRIVDEDAAVRGANVKNLKQGAVLSLTFESISPAERAPPRSMPQVAYQAQIWVELGEAYVHVVTVALAHRNIYPQTTLPIPLPETFMKTHLPGRKTSLTLSILLSAVGRAQETYSAKIDLINLNGDLANVGPRANLRLIPSDGQASPIILRYRATYSLLPSLRFTPVSTSLAESSREVEVTYVVRESKAEKPSVVVVTGYTCPLCSDLEGAGNIGSKGALVLHLLMGHRKEAKVDEKTVTEEPSKKGDLLKLTVVLHSRGQALLNFPNKYIKSHFTLPPVHRPPGPFVASSPSETAPLISHPPKSPLVSANPPLPLSATPVVNSIPAPAGNGEGALQGSALAVIGASPPSVASSSQSFIASSPSRADRLEAGLPRQPSISAEPPSPPEALPATSMEEPSLASVGNDDEGATQRPALDAVGASVPTDAFPFPPVLVSGPAETDRSMIDLPKQPLVPARSPSPPEPLTATPLKESFLASAENDNQGAPKEPAPDATGALALDGSSRVEATDVDGTAPVAQIMGTKESEEDSFMIPREVHEDTKKLVVTASSPQRQESREGELSAMAGTKNPVRDKSDDLLADIEVLNTQTPAIPSSPVKIDDGAPASPSAPPRSGLQVEEPYAEFRRPAFTPASLSHLMNLQSSPPASMPHSSEQSLSMPQSNAGILADTSNAEEGSVALEHTVSKEAVPDGLLSLLAKADESLGNGDTVDPSESEEECDDDESAKMKPAEVPLAAKSPQTSLLTKADGSPQHTAMVAAPSDAQDEYVFAPVIKTPRKTPVPPRAMGSVKGPIVRLTLPAQKSNLSELMSEQSSAAPSRSSSIATIEHDDTAMETDLDAAALNVGDETETPLSETSTTPSAQVHSTETLSTPKAAESRWHPSMPPEADVAKVAAIMQGSVLGENEKANEPAISPAVEAVSPSLLPGGLPLEPEPETYAQNQLHPVSSDSTAPPDIPRFTESGIAGPYMGQRVNEWTNWSHAIVPGTLFDFMHVLDEEWDCGNIRHVVKHQEASIWTRSHLSEKRRFMACCWNRWVHQKGSIPAINKPGYLKLFLDKYGKHMARAGIDVEFKDYLHIHFQMKHIPLADYVGACQYYKRIRESV
ncbi:hypothetical protein IAR50_002331 [Cryptococcus sp. DSM 104548]